MGTRGVRISETWACDYTEIQLYTRAVPALNPTHMTTLSTGCEVFWTPLVVMHLVWYLKVDEAAACLAFIFHIRMYILTHTHTHTHTALDIG